MEVLLMIPQSKKYSYEEFLRITKDIERVEYIDGEVYYLAAPSPEHQAISYNIERKLGNYFEGKECRVYHAPLDVLLEDEDSGEKKNVQPDIMVICDKSKFTDTNYRGIPTIIIEITSPSTASRDNLTKLNLYQRFQVPEYWIVSPKNRTVSVYCYEKEINAYLEPTIFAKDDIVNSSFFNDLSMELKDIFEI
jgi:Uma2 family endonuclease